MARIADAVLYATSPALLPDVRLNRHDNFVCGLVSGVMARSITSPIDVVRLLTQVSSGEKSTDFVRQIYKRDGIRGFWQGNFISVVNQGLYSGIKFLLLKELVSCRKFLFKSCCNSPNDGDSKGNKIICCTKPEFSQLEAAVAGGVSGVIAQTIVFPLDFLRTRMIVNPYKYTSIFQAIERIYQEEGICAFWSGLLPTIAGSIPYESSQYLIYGQLIHTFDEPLTPLQNTIAGTLAGMVSATIAYPFESVRKLMMITDEKTGKKKYDSMTQCFTSVIANEGVGGLYHGVVLNAVKVIPYSALQYTLYDEICSVFLKMKKVFGSRRHTEC